MLPDQFDVLSFREILLVIRATEDVNRDAWKRTATECTFIFNYAKDRKKSFTPKDPEDLFPKLYNKRVSTFQSRYDAAIEQEKVYQAQLDKKADRLAREKAEREASDLLRGE